MCCYLNKNLLIYLIVNVTLLIFILPGAILLGENIIVNTKYGQLKGITMISRDGLEYYQFLGIPYATPPIGILRYAPPIKPKKWNGTRDAILHGSLCMQAIPIVGIHRGSEDCLFLNVFTPNIPKINNNTNDINEKDNINLLLPVLIFIHGGLFMIGGSQELGPDYIMDEKIVFVTINYRLSSFGFLNTGDEIIKGNMGLKDQVLGLKWVHENIKYFGGNPNLITLGGHSSGGASVHYHMMSPMSKGLFHRAISMSGTALNHWSLMKTPKKQAKRFGKSLNCPTNSSILLLTCLRKISARDINRVHTENTINLPESRLATFSPTIETLKDTDAFLTKSPQELVKKKLINNVPWMTGVANADGLVYAFGILTNKTLQNELHQHWLKRAPILFDYEHLKQNERNIISQEIQQNYFDQNQINFKKLDNIIKLFTDIYFFDDLHESILANSNSSNTYVYFNTYQPNQSLGQIIFKMSLKLPFLLDFARAASFDWVKRQILRNNNDNEYNYGVSHGEGESLLFKFGSTIKPGSMDYNVSKFLTRTITYFAKHGKPPNFNDLTWPMVNSTQPLQFLQISKKPEIINDPILKRVEFWKILKNKYNF